MKKTLLFTFTFIFYLTGILNAQNLAFFTEEDGELENGTFVTIEMTPNSGDVTKDFSIVNKSSDAIDFKIKKIENVVLESTINTFCIAGSCFPPNLYEIPNAITLEGNSSYDDDFHVQYSPNNAVGTSSVTYVAFDANNSDDSTCIVVHYVSQEIIVSTDNLAFSTEEDGELENGTVITIEMTPTSGDVTKDFSIINKSSDAIDFKIKKIENELVENTMNTFCIAGSCFPPNLYEIPNAITLEGNSSYDDDFHVQFSPNNTIGTSSVTYVAFDANNTDDSTYIVVHYVSQEIIVSTGSLTLSTEDEGELTNGQEITVHTSADDAVAIKYVFVTNSSDESINVKVKKVEGEMLNDSENTFCWGQCFGPDVFESREPVAIASNAINNTDFSADYSAKGNSGTSYITYVFFNSENIQDSVAVVVKFTTETDGIDEHDFVKYLNAYPVPANDYLYINYDIDNCENISLKITNILGSEIRSQKITQTSGNIKLNTSDLQNGLYFYTIYSNNQPLSTKKIIVKH